jgi:uncharacterized protein YjbI with pentapeptide repeats
LRTAARASRCLILSAALTLGSGAGAEEDEHVSRKADMTVREIASALFRADPDAPVDLSRKNLAYLDLSGLDFKRARLSHADLYGVDFTRANLRGADLSQTRLDRAVLIGADLSGANLRGATIRRPTVYSDLSNNPADTPRFPGANLAGVRLLADLSGVDFHGADLSGANLSPQEATTSKGSTTSLAANVLTGCDFSRAILRATNFEGAKLTFARFIGADLKGANLSRTDLSRADFTGADLTEADLTNANLDGATLLRVKGLETVRGLAKALNFDRTIR